MKQYEKTCEEFEFLGPSPSIMIPSLWRMCMGGTMNLI